MALTHVEGNLKKLPMANCGQHNLSSAVHLWTIGGVGETLGVWALHRAGFGSVVKPLMLQGDGDGNRLILVSPNQLRQGLCWLSHGTERRYKESLTEEQMKFVFRWDFLAMKAKMPCLIEIKTQSGVESSDDYRLFRKRDFSKEKSAGFRVFCMKIALKDNWDFEVLFEEF